MDIKVRALDDSSEEKSSQQIEQELLDKHEAQFTDSEETNTTETVETPVAENTTTETTEEVAPTSELSEEDVLKFIGNRYGREITSLDELNQTREENDPLPEDVAQYLKYKKETGRGFNDFIEVQKNYDEMDNDALLRSYLTATENGLDADDIETLIESDYTYDEDLDDDKDIKKVQLKTKKTIAKAKEYFQKQQEQYSIPLESSGDTSNVDQEEIQAYRDYIANAKTMDESLKRKQEVFVKKTDDVFNEFKGFEFTVDDKKVYFNPGDANEIKNSQLNPQNFIQKFLDEQGTLSDAQGYHRSLAMAMHPEKFAKFFYEQGKSAAADKTMRELKNVKMDTRNAPEVTKSKDGLQVRSLNKDSGRGLKIRSRK
jgi:hypothetical protein